MHKKCVRRTLEFDSEALSWLCFLSPMYLVKKALAKSSKDEVDPELHVVEEKNNVEVCFLACFSYASNVDSSSCVSQSPLMTYSRKHDVSGSSM